MDSRVEVMVRRGAVLSVQGSKMAEFCRMNTSRDLMYGMRMTICVLV